MTNKELEKQVGELSSKLDKLVDVVSSQTEGVGTREKVEPKPEPAPALSGIPQKFRDTVDKHLGKDFKLVLENNDETLAIIVPDKYSVYHTEAELAARKSHHNTERSDFENLITRIQPNITKEMIEERMAEWEEKHPLTIPIDKRPLALALAVVANNWEDYCMLVKKNIEKTLDIKLEKND